MIYLDHSATTQPKSSVLDSFRQVAETYFANPSSIHEAGADVEQLQRAARKKAAELLEIDSEEVIFTSGGTEGNNLAIKGIALQYQHRGKHIITTETEHASVYETVKALETLGFEATFLPVDAFGRIQPTDVVDAIREDTILVSMMQVNNEIGTIQPVEEIGRLLKNDTKIFFHVDAVQALGKMPLHLSQATIDLCTMSGHKINGLNGTGMLYKRKGVQLFPLFHGGGQENGVRSGTENVAGNVSFVKALRLAIEEERVMAGHLRDVQQQLRQGLEQLAGVEINSPSDGAPHILHCSVPGLKPETIIHAMYDKGFAISTQSACASKSSDKSRVLQACGKNAAIAISGLRISLAYTTTKREVTAFLQAFKHTLEELKHVLKVDTNGV